MSDDEEKERIRSRVVAILTKYDPSRLDKVDSLLARFEGREDEMFKIMKERYKKPKEPEEAEGGDEVKDHGDGDEDEDLAQEAKKKLKVAKKEKSPKKKKKEKKEATYPEVSIMGNCVYFKCSAPYEGKEKLCKKHLGLLMDEADSPLTLAAHLYMHTFEKVNHDMVALYHIRVLAMMKDEPSIIVNVSTRFSELKELADCITKDYASHASADAIPKFPSKKRFASFKGIFNSHENLSEDFLQQRVKELRFWLKGLLEAPKIAKQPDFHAFFGLSEPLENLSNEEVARYLAPSKQKSVRVKARAKFSAFLSKQL